MGAVQRLQQFIDIKGISKYRFYHDTGLSNGSLDKGENIGTDKCEKIIYAYPEINLDWLITGQGPMLKEEALSSRISDRPKVQLLHQPPYTEKVEDQEVILYDVNAAANLKTLFDNKSQNILGRIKIPDMPRCDGAVYVNGDSMYPLLKSGDIIAYKEVHNFEYVIFGEMYLVSFGLDGDEYLTVKYVNKSDKENYIMLVSYNPHHHPMEIPISSINAIALIKFSIRKNTMI